MYAESAQARSPAVVRWMNEHANRLLVLRAILAASVVSTALHYTHNYLYVEHYPQSDLASNATTQLGILIVWPLLTGVGVLGYWLYGRRSYAFAHRCLALYSLLGIITLGHFVDGSPHIPAFWYTTIFTDALAGFAVLAFAAWSAIVAVPSEKTTTV